VRATLVSSGKAGYEPPRGLFRVNKKYAAKKMRGEDVADGSYDIDQVPYIMYYWASLALHGAYWHDDFGRVRSHGCTNLAPADARWLFRWAEPKLPPGWIGKVGVRGPWVYFTRGDQDAAG
jgi:lipoprotein-anchoring transpeptidase ErfK/SrfK